MKGFAIVLAASAVSIVAVTGIVLVLGANHDVPRRLIVLITAVTAPLLFGGLALARRGD